jgi:mono/diheme cytochrome c family protein
MRFSPLAVTALGSAALLAALVNVSCTSAPSNRQAALDPAAKVARGEYLVKIVGCGDCHTPGTFTGAPDMTRMLSGSEYGWQGPWGTSYARNLTPDMATGIGAWTEDQIVTAIKVGQRPDGTPLMPPMPWPDFANLTDEDAHAIAAYLKTLPVVSHKVPDKTPPGTKATQGSIIVVPPPVEWDAPRK